MVTVLLLLRRWTSSHRFLFSRRICSCALSWTRVALESYLTRPGCWGVISSPFSILDVAPPPVRGNTLASSPRNRFSSLELDGVVRLKSDWNGMICVASSPDLYCLSSLLRRRPYRIAPKVRAEITHNPPIIPPTIPAILCLVLLVETPKGIVLPSEGRLIFGWIEVLNVALQ